MLLLIINETWKRKGIKLKRHLGESRPATVMERRAYADRCQTATHGPGGCSRTVVLELVDRLFLLSQR